jgi:hypothetical protein
VIDAILLAKISVNQIPWRTLAVIACGPLFNVGMGYSLDTHPLGRDPPDFIRASFLKPKSAVRATCNTIGPARRRWNGEPGDLTLAGDSADSIVPPDGEPKGVVRRAPAILALKRGDASANRFIITDVLIFASPYASD